MLEAGAHGMSFNLAEGTSREVFQIPVAAGAGQQNASARIVTPICFEVTHSGFMRGLVYEGGRRRVDAIISPTNDGWFGISNEGREHHLLMARWRCVELHTPMVRAANTGVSAFIDASGRLLARGVEGDSRGFKVAGTLQGSLPFDPGARVTLFGRVGNVFGLGCLLATMAGVVGVLLGGRFGGPTGSKWSGKP
jgi:apolipoprotein N-acyltransferase